MTDTEELKSFTSPKWNTLPEIELYMDQVLTLISKHFGLFFGEDNMITPSMINNYVKAGIVPSPVKKRYAKQHIACIFMVCVLKRVLSINQIGKLFALMEAQMQTEQIYNVFCQCLDESVAYMNGVLSQEQNEYVVSSDKKGAVLALKCAVDAFSNAILSDIILQSEAPSEEPTDE